jgi:hypothetical protein
MQKVKQEDQVVVKLTGLITPKEYQEVQRAVKRLGMGVSKLIRTALMEFIRK